MHPPSRRDSVCVLKFLDSQAPPRPSRWRGDGGSSLVRKQALHCDVKTDASLKRPGWRDNSVTRNINIAHEDHLALRPRRGGVKQRPSGNLEPVTGTMIRCHWEP